MNDALEWHRDIPVPPPQQRTEQVVAEIWSEVLELPQVGPQDNFFDLGGHSLLLAMVREGIARRLGRDVPLVELFAHPTVSALARYLDGGGRSSQARPRALDRARLGSRPRRPAGRHR